eukprot:5816882-Prorocentrum_lima.AAC.1
MTSSLVGSEMCIRDSSKAGGARPFILPKKKTAKDDTPENGAPGECSTEVLGATLPERQQRSTEILGATA